MTNWRPEVKVEGKWSKNQIVFATEGEALKRAKHMEAVWTLVTDHRATETLDPVNYMLEPDGTMTYLGEQRDPDDVMPEPL